MAAKAARIQRMMRTSVGGKVKRQRRPSGSERERGKSCGRGWRELHGHAGPFQQGSQEKPCPFSTGVKTKGAVPRSVGRPGADGGERMVLFGAPTGEVY